MPSPTIFKGNFVKMLKSRVETFNNWRMFMDLTDNPNTTAVDARRGSIYIRPTLGDPEMFIKLDDGSTTNWQKVNKLDPQTIAFINADETDLTSIATGNNAVFDGGGTFQGTLSKSTLAADLISGSSAFKWVGNATAGSNTNDYASHGIVNIPQGSRGKYLVFLVKAKWDGGADNMAFRLKDTTNGAILPPVGSDTLANITPADNESTFYSFMYFIPSDCEQVECGFQCTTGESSRTLIWDDIIFTEDAFRTISLAGNALGAAISHNGTTAAIVSQGPEESIQSVLSVSVGGIDVTFVPNFFQEPPVIVGTVRNDTNDTLAISSVSTTGFRIDTLTPTGAGSASDVSIVIIPQGVDALNKRSTIVRASSFAPISLRTGAANGHGSTNTHIRRWNTTPVEAIGNVPTLVDSATDGTYFEIQEDGLYSINYVDGGGVATNIGFGITKTSPGETVEGATNVYSLADNTRLIALCRPQNGSTNPYDTASGERYLKKGDRLYAHTDTFPNQDSIAFFSITKIGTSQVVGVPFPRFAWVEDQKATTVQGQTLTAGLWNTRNVNTIKPTSDPGVITSVASDRIVFSKGRHKIRASVIHYLVNSFKCRLHNVTTNTTVVDGVSTTGRNETSGQNILALIDCYIESNGTDEYEIQSWVQTTRSNGGGQRSDAGDGLPERYLILESQFFG